jgi:hypothetical protein
MDHDRKEDRELLRRNGFAEAEMNQLSRLRKHYYEQKRLQMLAERRRFEFIRWLISTGKLTDQTA